MECAVFAAIAVIMAFVLPGDADASASHVWWPNVRAPLNTNFNQVWF